jgi:hypothetical protein
MCFEISNRRLFITYILHLHSFLKVHPNIRWIPICWFNFSCVFFPNIFLRGNSWFLLNLFQIWWCINKWTICLAFVLPNRKSIYVDLNFQNSIWNYLIVFAYILHLNWKPLSLYIKLKPMTGIFASTIIVIWFWADEIHGLFWFSQIVKVRLFSSF